MITNVPITSTITQGKVYFLGDLHLGTRWHSDSREIEQKLVTFFSQISSDASVVCLMGDIFDYWFEYKHVVPKGYVRFLSSLALLVQKGIEVHILAGNHDVWMKEYFAQELGVVVHHQGFVADWLGKRFYIAHGDRECRDESRSTHFLYSLFRNTFCQRMYGWLHPDLTMGFALSCSLKSRKKQTSYRKQDPYYDRFSDPQKELLVQKSREYIQQRQDLDFYVYGHRHLLVCHPLDSHTQMIVTGEWVQHSSYVVWDGKEMALFPEFETK